MTAKYGKQQFTDGRILKDLMSRELATSKSACGRPDLHFKNICKSDIRVMDIDIKNWEDYTNDFSL